MSEVRAARYRGVLRDPGPGVGKAMGPSVLGHGLLLVALVAGVRGTGPPPPLERDAFLVSAIVLPKAKALPTKASAPRPAPSGEAGKAAPEPPRPDEMVLREKDDPTKGEERTPSPEEPTPAAERKPSRAELIANLDDETKDVRFATDVEGSDDADPRDALRQRFGAQLSAYQREVRDAIQRNWFPKSSRGVAPPELWAAVTFTIDESGTISSPAIEAESGDFVYDQSCQRAVIRTGRVPPPPAEEPRTITVGFSPKDKE